MMALVLGLLLLPICATVAGFSVWTINRRQTLDDGDLIRDFLIILAICILLAWAVSGTTAVRLCLDPQFRLQTEMDAHPIYSTIKRLSHPDDIKELNNFLVLQLSHGGTLPEAFLQARALLTRLTNNRLGWADQRTRLAWAQVTVDSLKELQSLDPMLCYRVLSAKPPNQAELAHVYSAENTKAFQRGIVEVYESAALGISNKRPPEDKHVEFNAAALEYSVIQGEVAERFGEPISKVATNKRAFPEIPTESPEKICAARIFQLEAMLERPQPMAAFLIDSILR